MSLHDHLGQRIVDVRDMLASEDVTPEVRAAGRSGLDQMLGESVLELAREVDGLRARVAELEAER